MPKKPPLRSPSDTHRRQAIAERRIGARQCGCGEARPQALIAGSRPLVCAACQRANNGQSTEDDHHIAGAANDETTISVPVNDHRADLTIAQSDWPKATLQNSEGSPLLAGAACIREPKLLDPTPSERIERDLHNISRNQIEWWLQLTLDMSLEPTSTNHTNDLELDLTTLPGWKEADTGTRERILNAARDYVNDADPHNENWFSSPSTPYSAIGGARALALLQTAAPEILDAISSQTWQKWVPSLVRYPVTEEKGRLLKANLLQRANSIVPVDVIERLEQQIDQDNEQHRLFLIGTDIESLVDDGIGKGLLNKATDPALKGSVVGALLQLLLRHNVPGSRDLAESYITAVLPMDERQQSRMIAAIQALIAETPDASWLKVWPLIRDNDELGKKIIEAASYGGFGETSIPGKLSEWQLAQLYLWMVRNYPYPEHNSLRAGAMGPVDTAVMLRDGILENLKRRATFAACNALRDVIESLPQYPGLRHQLEEAESLARAATWQPISTRQFLALAFDHRKRLIENGDELIEVVLESLDRLNLKLHAELTPVKYLWVPSGDGYLKDARCRNGIYLVGWYSSPSWDKNDYRKRKCPRMSLNEAKQFFLNQATDLSTEGYSIRSYMLNLSLS